MVILDRIKTNAESAAGSAQKVWASFFVCFALSLFALSSSGCQSREQQNKIDAERVQLEKERSQFESQRDQFVADLAQIEERENKIATASQSLDSKAEALELRDQELRTWESELRAEDDKLKAQVEAIREQINLLEKRQQELFELQSAKLRGPAPEIHGKRAIVIDADSGKVLFEKSAHEPCAVASTQKLMTGLLVAEAGELDSLITVDEEDTKVEPTKLYIKPGEQIPRRTILNGLLVRSGNDLALCLARDCAGSVEAFAKKMNLRAIELGMRASHFINPHGLTEKGQQSTASDMAKLARAAYNNPVIRNIVNQKTFVFEHGDGTKKPLTNTNRVLREFEFCDGMKTGYTNASGKCLICSGKHGNHTRIVVILGSAGSYVWKDARALLEWSLKG